MADGVGALLDCLLGRAVLPDDEAACDRLFCLADRHHVLAALALAVQDRGDGKRADILANAMVPADADRRMLKFEINRLERALYSLDIRPVLLKGGAYVALDLAVARGRRVSDLDILIEKSRLPDFEKALNAVGWRPDEKTDNAYDRAYYRNWMHELPPLRHRNRKTLMDVHHALIPPTARHQLDTAGMIAASIPIPGSGLRTLNMVDLFIHSATHALADGEFATPLRSLLELDALFTALGPSGRSAVPGRLKQVGGAMAVTTAMWILARRPGRQHARDLYETLCKQDMHPALLLTRWAMMVVLTEAPFYRLARFFLWARGHWLRMPLPLLIRHALTKGWMSLSAFLTRKRQRDVSAP